MFAFGVIWFVYCYGFGCMVFGSFNDCRLRLWWVFIGFIGLVASACFLDACG